jgi:hypothetical protein
MALITWAVFDASHMVFTFHAPIRSSVTLCLSAVYLNISDLGEITRLIKQ